MVVGIACCILLVTGSIDVVVVVVVVVTAAALLVVVWFGCVLTRCFERTREVPLPLLIAWAPIISLLLVWTHPTNKLYHLLAYYLFVCCYVSNVLYNNFRRRNRQSRGSLLESTRVASKFYH